MSTMIRKKMHSLKFTLTSVVALLILFSVFLSAMLSYKRYAYSFQSYSAEQMEQTMDQLAINLNTYLDELFRLTTYIYYDENVVTAMDTKSGSELDSLQRHRIIESYLDKIMVMPRKDILNIFVITNDIYFGGRMPKSVDTTADYQSYDWYLEAMGTQSPIIIPPGMEQLITYPKDMVFSVVKQLRSVQNIDEIIGIIRVDASYDSITDIWEKIDLGREGGIFLIDNDKNIIYSNAPAALNTILDTITPGINSSRIEGSGISRYMITTKYVKNGNWTIVAITSINELTRSARETRSFTLLLATFSSLFAILVLLIFTDRFLKPLMDIVQLMKEVRKGNFDVSFAGKCNDEIGYLGNSFNSMVATINDNIAKNTELATKVYEFEILHSEAKFQALQSQIKPHFLYNTLNMISMQIQIGQSERAVENIENLHYLLRTMAKQKEETSVADEFTILEAYLKIQSSRFGQRLSYHLEIADVLKEQIIPSFILQPLVENAVVHGCENQRSQTTITVTGQIQDGLCYFSVCDNGTGIEPAHLRELQEQLADSAHHSPEDVHSESGGHIGLLNVHKRIQLCYGVQYGIKIQSQYGSGTQVFIILPLTKGDLTNVSDSSR